ncbi:Cyclin-U4-1 [Madurella mycetomatis]|uniref:Cyclin-U4-1 n=1 Tax=Madurella mycetomatis TaxID=100816 RepID=A0A175W806_9PEZI|nr:Cyclin-U4-1 [Madurella mycetomatis]
MAAMIGDVFAEPTPRFHSMIGGHSHDIHYQSRSVSRSRDRDAQTHHARPTSSPRRQASVSLTAGTQPQPQPQPQSRRDWNEAAQERVIQQQQGQGNRQSASGGAARLPSPPSSSSSSEASSSETQPRHGISSDSTGDSATGPFSTSSSASSASTATTVIPAPSRAMPSPDSDSGVALPLDEPPESPMPTQTTIRVRDLAHIQSLARADLLTATGPGILNDPPLQQMKYEISGMPIGDIIEMVAALLTKITTTNDLQHDALNRNAHHLRQAQAQARGEEGSSESSMSPLSSSVLAFHGKNVPAITILSYLSRIHKYCPTTYEVFLSLLVYFDRMTERVNDMVMRNEEARRQQLEALQQQQQLQQQTLPQTQSAAVVGPRPGVATEGDADRDTVMRDDDDDDDDDNEDETDSDETDSDLADDTSTEADEQGGRRGSRAAAAAPLVPGTNNAAAAAQATYFVVDSFNIHRLIIAGVTCASKFFSDVFYTNSRYAKVGGLPLAELNHLELQFLLLNDFRLAVPVEDLEAYATMLVEFYAREVIAQRS